MIRWRHCVGSIACWLPIAVSLLAAPLATSVQLATVSRETRLAPKNQKPFKRQLQRIRRICLALPDTTEKLSHGEPTFFTKQGVFAMFANDHHRDGYVGVWLPAPLGLQEALIEEDPSVYYRPPYVGSSGWIGIDLPRIHDDAVVVENPVLVASVDVQPFRGYASRR